MVSRGMPFVTSVLPRFRHLCRSRHTPANILSLPRGVIISTNAREQERTASCFIRCQVGMHRAVETANLGEAFKVPRCTCGYGDQYDKEALGRSIRSGPTFSEQSPSPLQVVSPKVLPQHIRIRTTTLIVILQHSAHSFRYIRFLISCPTTATA